MSLMSTVCLTLALTLIGLSDSQCVNRIRQVVPVSSSGSCGCSDDLTTIVQLAKALNEIEGGSSNNNCNNGYNNAALNVDGIISKLINALIVATVGGSTSTSNNGSLLNLGLGGQDILKLL